jgi:hypothetical protein
MASLKSMRPVCFCRNSDTKTSQYFRGGLDAFNATIMNPSAVIPAGTRWDADVFRFRESARNDILAMIEKNKIGGLKEIKKVKKIQGGC